MTKTKNKLTVVTVVLVIAMSLFGLFSISASASDEDIQEACAHEYDNNCDWDCNLCEEFREAPHTLTTHVDAKVPANCQETGYDEHWICADCGGYFMSNGMGGYTETNPAWINYPGEHVRPEGAAGCAVVACTVCGEDSYGTDPCVRGENTPACQDGTCVNCGGVVYGEGHSYGYDEETWEPLNPFCQPGDCIYCGEHLEYIYECENGSYAPCTVEGECMHGCGKQYPATGIHEVDDPCAGGMCWLCWEDIEPAHDYVDGKCTVCGADDPDYVVETPDEETPDEETPDEETPDEETPVEPEKDHNNCKTESNPLKDILNAIINFFRKLFGLPEVCICGEEK